MQQHNEAQSSSLREDSKLVFEDTFQNKRSSAASQRKITDNVSGATPSSFHQRDSQRLDSVGGGAIDEHYAEDHSASLLSQPGMRNSSIASIQSTNSKEENLRELLTQVEDLKGLIKDEEWFNIPVAVRQTCENLIAYQHKLTETLVYSAESAHSNALVLQEKQRRFENQTKLDFERHDAKLESHSHQQTENQDRLRGDLKREITTNYENITKMSNLLQGIQGTLDVWDGKIRRVDTKMAKLEEFGARMEEQAISQKKYHCDFQLKMAAMFHIPGLMGEKDCTYHDIADFVKNLHTHKSESLDRLEKRVLQEKKRSDHERKALEEDVMDLLKGQERRLAQLDRKCDELEELVQEAQAEEESSSEGEGQAEETEDEKGQEDQAEETEEEKDQEDQADETEEEKDQDEKADGTDEDKIQESELKKESPADSELHAEDDRIEDDDESTFQHDADEVVEGLQAPQQKSEAELESQKRESRLQTTPIIESQKHPEPQQSIAQADTRKNTDSKQSSASQPKPSQQLDLKKFLPSAQLFKEGLVKLNNELNHQVDQDQKQEEIPQSKAESIASQKIQTPPLRKDSESFSASSQNVPSRKQLPSQGSKASVAKDREAPSRKSSHQSQTKALPVAKKSTSKSIVSVPSVQVRQGAELTEVKTEEPEEQLDQIPEADGQKKVAVGEKESRRSSIETMMQQSAKEPEIPDQNKKVPLAEDTSKEPTEIADKHEPVAVIVPESETLSVAAPESTSNAKKSEKASVEGKKEKLTTPAKNQQRETKRPPALGIAAASGSDTTKPPSSKKSRRWTQVRKDKAASKQTIVTDAAPLSKTIKAAAFKELSVSIDGSSNCGELQVSHKKVKGKGLTKPSKMKVPTKTPSKQVTQQDKDHLLAFEQRVDDLIDHQAKFEAETSMQFDQLQNMLIAFSASIWRQEQQRIAAKDVNTSDTSTSKRGLRGYRQNQNNTSTTSPQRFNNHQQQLGSQNKTPQQRPNNQASVAAARRQTLKVKQEQEDKKLVEDQQRKGGQIKNTSEEDKSAQAVSGFHDQETVRTSDQGDHPQNLKERLEKAEEQALIYTESVAKKYHFIEAYLSQFKVADGNFLLYRKNYEQSSVINLRSKNWSQSQRGFAAHLISPPPTQPSGNELLQILDSQSAQDFMNVANQRINLDASIRSVHAQSKPEEIITDPKKNRSSFSKNKQYTATDVVTTQNLQPAPPELQTTNPDLKQRASKNSAVQSVASADNKQGNILVSGSKSSLENSKDVVHQLQHHLEINTNSMTEESRAMSRATSRREALVNDCPKCRGQTDKRPCLEWVEILREEFTVHIDGLFRKKMQEFIDFIEEYLNVEDQIDPEQDNVIHAFYRKHNTLQKTNENFRLLEYKRKKYLEKKKQQGNHSNSPSITKSARDNDNSPVQKQRNKLKTQLYHNPTELAQIGKQSTVPELTTAFQRFAQNSDDPLKAMCRSIQVERDPQMRMSQAITTARVIDGSKASARNGSMSFVGKETIPQRNVIRNLYLSPKVDLKIQDSAKTTKRLKMPSSSHFRYDDMLSTRVADVSQVKAGDPMKQPQLPIISMRKAHLTSDQRVWEDTQFVQQSKETVAFSGNDQNPMLGLQSSEVFAPVQPASAVPMMSKPEVSVGIMQGESVMVYQPQAVMPNSAALKSHQQFRAPAKIMSQDRSGSFAGQPDQRNTKNLQPLQPLAVQFQELRPSIR